MATSATKITVSRTLTTFSVGLMASFVFGLFFVTPARSANNYHEPAGSTGFDGDTSGSPDNLGTFISGSAYAQKKLGSLIIGQHSAPSKLCLAGNPALGSNDPSCITHWADLETLIATHLRLFSPGTTDIDSGYVNLIGNPVSDVVNITPVPGGSPQVNQLITLIAEANPTVPQSAAIAALSNASSHYAAKVAGTLDVGGLRGKICFQNDTNCVTQWSDLTTVPSDIVRLQTSVNYVPDDGSIAVGNTFVVQDLTNPTFPRSSMVVGQPVSGTSVLLTCGDGLCSAVNGENSVSCQSDCK